MGRVSRRKRDETLQPLGVGGPSARAGPVLHPGLRDRRRARLRAAGAGGGPELYHQGRDRDRNLARCDRRGDAGSGLGPDREEAAGAALFRSGPDLHQAVLHGDAGCVPRLHPGKGGPAALLSTAQEARRSTAGAAARPHRPERQRRIRRRRLDPLHAHWGRRRLRAAQDGRGGIRQRLLKVPSAVKVNLYGVQDEKIFVEFSHAKLATLGIPPQALFDSLQRQNAVVPAGTIETGAQRIPLRITGSLDGARAVAETPVEAAGRTFRLGDIATVTRGFEDPSDYLVRQRGKPALGVGVVMAKGANILDFGKAVGAAKDEFMGAVPQGIDIEQIADQPRIVDHAILEFLRSFGEALAIVLVVSFLSLGWRTGIVVALSVPLVLAITFVVMAVLGIDLHRITLGALIIALGLLVDDAIIAVEMMVVKIEQGWDPMRAAAFAWTSTAFPMLTGTLVTAAGFLPIGFANSSVGEYAGGIFWVVAIALVASWFVAVIFTPYLGVKL